MNATMAERFADLLRRHRIAAGLSQETLAERAGLSGDAIGTPERGVRLAPRCILPKHLLAQYKTINEAPYNALPFGIGPFKYERWDREQDVVLVANPLYFRGTPKLQKITFMIIPNRQTTLVELEAHEIDMWYGIPGTFLPAIKSVTGVQVLERPGYEWYHLDFNLTSPALQDPVVRRALRLAYDRATVLNKIPLGLGTLSDSPTPSNAPYNIEMPPTPYDPSLASQMLDKDGWKVGPDGIRVKNGVTLNLRYAIYSGAPEVDDAIEVPAELATNWRRVIGKTLSSRNIFRASKRWRRHLRRGQMGHRKFLWINDAIGDYSFIYGCDFTPTGQDVPHWCNDKAMAAMSAIYSHYDQNERNAEVRQFVEQFVQDAPVIVAYFRTNLYALNSDITGFDPNSITPFDNVMSVDI
jgi:ABC-type transport system substrate-binding protein